MKTVQTTTLRVGYLEAGPKNGIPVVLLHGWPSDVHDWDGVIPLLASAGHRVLVPWLRGFGETQFLRDETLRSGQQAALAQDICEFMQALGLASAVLVGYDWGGRGARGVAARDPRTVRGLVSIGGFSLYNVRKMNNPAPIEHELRYWYQWYLNTERGRAGLEQNRFELARILWRQWSPNWNFDEPTFRLTAASFNNPDFIDVTLHAYRHRYGNAPGDPELEALESFLSTEPLIAVPTVVVRGETDGVEPPASGEEIAGHYASTFSLISHPTAGHFLSRESPETVAEAVDRVLRLADR